MTPHERTARQLLVEDVERFLKTARPFSADPAVGDLRELLRKWELGLIHGCPPEPAALPAGETAHFPPLPVSSTDH
jgi:hypothetical protein